MSSPPNSPLPAAVTVAGLLPKLGGAVAGLSALALLVGWREAQAYFSALGTPWFTESVSAAGLITRSAGLMTTIAFSVVLSVYNLSQGTATVKGLRRWSIILLFLAAPLFFAGSLPGNLFSKNGLYVCYILGAYATSISGGLTIGEVIARLSESDLQWDGYHVWLLYLAVSYGIFQAPDRIGYAQAQVDTDIGLSRLPKVVLTPVNVGESWRLVCIQGDKALLALLTTDGRDNVFRIVGVGDVQRISSTKLPSQ